MADIVPHDNTKYSLWLLSKELHNPAENEGVYMPWNYKFWDIDNFSFLKKCTQCQNENFITQPIGVWLSWRLHLVGSVHSCL